MYMYNIKFLEYVPAGKEKATNNFKYLRVHIHHISTQTFIINKNWKSKEFGIFVGGFSIWLNSKDANANLGYTTAENSYFFFKKKIIICNFSSLHYWLFKPNPTPLLLASPTASKHFPTASKSPNKPTCPRSVLTIPPLTNLYPSGTIAAFARQTPSPDAKAKSSYASAHLIASREETRAASTVGTEVE